MCLTQDDAASAGFSTHQACSHTSTVNTCNYNSLSAHNMLNSLNNNSTPPPSTTHLEPQGGSTANTKWERDGGKGDGSTFLPLWLLVCCWGRQQLGQAAGPGKSGKRGARASLRCRYSKPRKVRLGMRTAAVNANPKQTVLTIIAHHPPALTSGGGRARSPAGT